MTFSPTFEKALCAIALAKAKPNFQIGQPVYCKPGVSSDPSAYIVQHLKSPMFGVGEWLIECTVEDQPTEIYQIPASWLTDKAPAERSAYVRRALMYVVEGGRA